MREALRRLERMDHALRRELGTTPSPAVEELRRSLLAGSGQDTERPRERPTNRLVGRRDVVDVIRERVAAAEEGRGTTLLVTGPPGVGKSAVLDLAAALAGRRGWRIGRGTASAVEGPWPYAPVLEALGDLCRRHPILLDGLADNSRHELDRALSAREVSWTGESAHQRLFVAAAELLRLAAAGKGLLLVVDDVHEADEASLRLLHYLARCALGERAVIALHRQAGGLHLLQRIYGTMIAAAPDPASARAVVDQAEATLRENDTCPFCTVMLAVPAAIACADADDLDGARRHLALAEQSAARWDGQAWDAAVLEARAHVARAEGRVDEYPLMMAEAARVFASCGHPLDAERCRAALHPVPPPLSPADPPTRRERAAGRLAPRSG